MVVVPAVIEFPLIFVRPFPGNMKWAVRSATSPIHEKRFVRREGFVLFQPGNRVIREVLAQVIVIVTAGSVRMLNIGSVPDKLRFPL